MLRTPGMTKKLGFLGVGPDEAESLCLGKNGMEIFWRWVEQKLSSGYNLGYLLYIRGLYYPDFFRNVIRVFWNVAQFMFSNCYRFVDSFEKMWLSPRLADMI